MTIDQTAHSVAAAFTELLRRPSDQTALSMSESLHQNGDSRRAEFLAAFVSDGPHTRTSDWWAPRTECRVSILPPSLDDMTTGHLWFDPLELTWSIAVPWPREPGEQPGDFPHLPPFLCWFPLDRVTDWQLAGAHQIAPDIPATMARVSAVRAWRYCALFGKLLTNHADWSAVGRIFGENTTRRLWGDSPGEVGLGGPNDGDAHLMYLQDVLNAGDYATPDPQVTSDDAEDGLCFRAVVNLQAGLIQEVHTLPRVWNA